MFAVSCGPSGIARVKALTSQCMRHKCFDLEIDALPFGGQAGSDVDWSGGVAATKALPDQSDDGVLSSGFSTVGDSATTADKAPCNIVGSALPRFSARRRMPAQAFGLKKYRGGRSPVSKISDNEHTASPLGNGTGKAACSDVLSVQHSVGPPIPEFAQAPEEGTKVPSAARRQDAGDVLPNHPLGPVAVNQSQIDEGQVAARIVQSFSKPGDAEGLAGGSTNEKIDSCIRPFLKTGHVAPVRDAWVMMGENRRWERLDLAESDGAPAERLPCDAGGLDAAADAQISKGHVHARQGASVVRRLRGAERRGYLASRAAIIKLGNCSDFSTL